MDIVKIIIGVAIAVIIAVIYVINIRKELK